VLLSGCALHGGAPQPCKIIDPELAGGSYRGGCSDGWADGYGVVTGAGSYRGDFVAGKKHGRGEKVMPNGDRYSGEFFDDYRHGHGTYIWGEATPWAGDRYEGEYQRDLRHGWGVFEWNSGDRYEGPWENDFRMYYSVMEVRRAQAAEAAANAAKVGNELCAEEPWDGVNIQLLRGTVLRVTGKLAQVRLLEVEGGMTTFKGATLTAGDLLTDEAAHWQPCVPL
jgi:hypothetical protein